MHKGDMPLIYAISHIPLSRLSDEVCADLVRADIPIGRILKIIIMNLDVRLITYTLKSLMKN